MTNKMRLIKVIGLVTGLVGTGAALVSDWVEKQEINQLIDDKIAKALAELEEDDGDEEES